MAVESVSRPQSRCATGPNLAVRGTTPLISRAGSRSGQLKTGSRPGSQMSPVDALAATLVTKMREKFGEAGKDVLAQELITQECRNYMLKNGSMHEGDLTALEETIRMKLSGRTPPRKTMVLERKARLQGDEWGRIWNYESARVKREVNRDRDVDQERKDLQRKLLDQQVQMKQQIEEEEKQQYIKDGAAISQDVKQWQQQEAARKAAALEKVMQFKEMRESQVKEKELRRQMARDKIAAEEEETAARIAYEVKAEFEKEAAVKAAAKQALVSLLAGNEENKKMKEMEKERQKQEDLEYMRRYEEILDKQEKDRIERLQKLKDWQDKNESKAASMPESKRWLDPAIIQRNWEEKEAALKNEDDRRRNAVTERNRRMVSALNKQVTERNIQKQTEKEAADEHSRTYLAGAAAEKQKDLEEKRQRVQQKINAKMELEAQMRENARRRREASMSEVEKLMNKKLLENVDTYEHSQLCRPLQAFPPQYLPKDLTETEKTLTYHHSRQELRSARGLPKPEQ